MIVRGAAAVAAEYLARELAVALFEGRPAFLWSDGVDAILVEAGEGEGAEDVLKFARRAVLDSL